MQVGVGDVHLCGDLAPEDEAELDLVVEEPDAARMHHVAVGRDDAARRLGEDHVEGLRVGVDAGLDHVLAVVRALADELLVPCDRRQDLDRRRVHLVAAQVGEEGGRDLPDEVAGGREPAGYGRDAMVADHTPPDAVQVSEADDVNTHHRRSTRPWGRPIAGKGRFAI